MPRDLPVSAVMTTDVVTLSPATPLEDAIRLLARHDISGAPVVDPEGHLVGMLDDTDLILTEARLHAPTTIELFGAYLQLPGEHRRFEEEVRHALGREVVDVMDPKPPTVTPESTLEDVATLFVERRVSRLPVVDADRRVLGIVTRGDLVRALGRGDQV
jgi:CBS domain-containing protein